MVQQQIQEANTAPKTKGNWFVSDNASRTNVQVLVIFIQTKMQPVTIHNTFQCSRLRTSEQTLRNNDCKMRNRS